jgi:hypothetical protein
MYDRLYSRSLDTAIHNYKGEVIMKKFNRYEVHRPGQFSPVFAKLSQAKRFIDTGRIA